MIETNIKDINVDEIMEKIKKQIEKNKNYIQNIETLNIDENCKQLDVNVTLNGKNTKLYKMGKKIAQLLYRLKLHSLVQIIKGMIPDNVIHSKYYTLDDFTRYQDEKFVYNSYKTILLREPDASGCKNFLNRLRNGELTKIDILGRLRFSKEGRDKAVKIKGLLFLFSLNLFYNKIPVIGYFPSVFVSIIRLPVILKSIYQFEAYYSAKNTQSNNQINKLTNQINKLTNQIDELTNQIDELTNQIDELTNKSNQFKDNILDSMYADFEDKFRGTKEEIKKRLKVYIPYLEQIKEKIGVFSTLDMGCGRGEWLELLQDNGFAAKGIDINRIMIQQCKESGFEVKEADAIDYLKEQKPDSIGVITGFHIVEHMLLESLIMLLDESLRVLKPGGVLMLETPNPENIIVGSCNFYVDPTHEKPIPPVTLKYLLESRGANKIDIIRFNRFDMQSFKNKFPFNLFYGNEDYAVIGYKI